MFLLPGESLAKYRSRQSSEREEADSDEPESADPLAREAVAEERFEAGQVEADEEPRRTSRGSWPRQTGFQIDGAHPLGRNASSRNLPTSRPRRWRLRLNWSPLRFPEAGVFRNADDDPSPR